MPFFSKKYHPAGTPPGTLPKKHPNADHRHEIHLVEYSADSVKVVHDVDPSQCRDSLRSDANTWIHVEGHPDESTMREMGERFGIHVLALEDVMNSGQRPKIEAYDDQLFIIMSLPTMEGAEVAVAQLSLVVGENYVISFCHLESSVFDPIVERLQKEGGRMRCNNIGFLLYGLLDVVIDRGFPVLEEFGAQLEDLETQILNEADLRTLEKIHTVRRELILLRRMLWPQREVINKLTRDDFPHVDEQTLIYFRDCYDHTIQILDLLETYRDMTSSMLDIYLSSVSNKTNEVMRVLTVIATIFIPLTFIAGIYGMNFDRSAGPWNMPELGWAYGYFAAWIVMIALAVLMLVYFRRRRWF